MGATGELVLIVLCHCGPNRDLRPTVYDLQKDLRSSVFLLNSPSQRPASQEFTSVERVDSNLQIFPDPSEVKVRREAKNSYPFSPTTNSSVQSPFGNPWDLAQLLTFAQLPKQNEAKNGKAENGGSAPPGHSDDGDDLSSSKKLWDGPCARGLADFD